MAGAGICDSAHSFLTKTLQNYSNFQLRISHVRAAFPVFGTVVQLRTAEELRTALSGSYQLTNCYNIPGCEPTTNDSTNKACLGPSLKGFLTNMGFILCLPQPSAFTEVCTVAAGHEHPKEAL